MPGSLRLAYAERMHCLLVAMIAGADPQTPEPKEFIAIMEQSPREYAVDSIDHPPAQWAQQNAMLAWPGSEQPLGIIKREPRKGGGWSIVAWTRPAEVEQMLEVAEPLFEAKRFKEAEAEYAKLLARFPAEYPVQLHWGDAALMDGRPAVALPRYEAATKMNPVDFHSWWYRGDALAALKRPKEAVPFWTRALALQPRNQELRAGLELNLKSAGLMLAPPVVLPRARVTLEGDKTRITVEPSAAWLAWAMCKAVWASEPDFRERMTGRREHTFTMLEERQCLVNLAAAYATRDKKKDLEDETAQRVLDVAKAKMLDGLIVFELASRVMAEVTATTDEAGLAALETYLKKFVLVPARKR